MVSDRQKFAELVKENAEPDLAAMGLDIVSFNVQNFVDENGVIENLGVDKSCADYVDYIKNHQEVKDLNSYFQRNEGYVKSLQNDKVIK
mgnify:CR=1 FL=1